MNYSVLVKGSRIKKMPLITLLLQKGNQSKQWWNNYNANYTFLCFLICILKAVIYRIHETNWNCVWVYTTRCIHTFEEKNTSSIFYMNNKQTIKIYVHKILPNSTNDLFPFAEHWTTTPWSKTSNLNTLKIR